MRIKEFDTDKKKEILLIFLLALIVIISGIAYLLHLVNIQKCGTGIRLDQYSTAILAATAGVVGTMFGLTAASYAFIWGDVRSDSQGNRHLSKVLEYYSWKLWFLFRASLISTIFVIITSLTGLALVQYMTNPSLFKTVRLSGGFLAKYHNQDFFWISFWTGVNLIISIGAVGIMARMNYTVFNRNNQYAVIARSILNQIRGNYDMEIFDEKEEDSDSIEFKKIHNLEILVKRLLKNHESVGEAFAESQRREKLLTAIIEDKLKVFYDIKDEQQKDVGKQKRGEWNCLSEDKRVCRYNQCRYNARQEYKMLDGEKNIQEAEKGLPKPCSCSFLEVYEDLMLYRDNSLVWMELHKKEYKKRYLGIGDKKKEQQKYQNMFEQRALRYTIKKRLMFFYLQGERFSDMDLTGISFSGADLRYTNLSGCNLTGIRLMGTNCEGADFTGSKMTGMYFEDMNKAEAEAEGGIKLTCVDEEWYEDNTVCTEVEKGCGRKREGCCNLSKKWDPYRGKEATCFIDATFKEADVSRTYLKAPGELEEKQVFPFGRRGNNYWKLKEEQKTFSMKGTNFDYAKMFFSYFKNIDFTNSSLARAQMYNIGMVQTKAKSANFAGSVLTNACIAWCDFENADFTDASMAETVLLRANFSGAKMENVNFSYSNIVACNFEGVSCQNASFKNIIQDFKRIENKKPKAIEEVCLNGPGEVRFCYATLTNTDFSDAQLDDMVFSNSLGQNCIFTRARGRGVVFDNAIFNFSIFNSARFENGSLNKTVFRNSIFTKTQFINSEFVGTDFSEVLFAVSDEPHFVGGYMKDVDFSNAKGLSAASFSNICLIRTNFSRTGIQKSDFLKSVGLIGCIFQGERIWGV